MYDVAIIGGGPAAIFAAYEFVMKYPKLKLVMLEAGNAIDKRFCPLAAKKSVSLHQLQALQYHAWLWWCRCFFGWQV